MKDDVKIDGTVIRKLSHLSVKQIKTLKCIGITDSIYTYGIYTYGIYIYGIWKKDVMQGSEELKNL